VSSSLQDGKGTLWYAGILIALKVTNSMKQSPS